MPQWDYDTGKILSLAEYKLIEYSDEETLIRASEGFNLKMESYDNKYAFIKAMDRNDFNLFIKRIRAINESKKNSDSSNLVWIDNEEIYPLDNHRFSEINDYLANYNSGDWHDPALF